MSAEKDVEKWDQAIRMNPDYEKEQEEKARKWEEDQKEKNDECLRIMRTLVPPDIMSSNKKKMAEEGIPRALAQRLWSKKGIWMVRMHPDDIRKTHIADLRSKYGNQGLDIIEMRAIWHSLPDEFDNDGDGKKAEWKKMFLQKLQELTKKEEQNRLMKNETRHSAYKEVIGKKLYDPDAPLQRAGAVKSSAFDATEQAVVTTSLKDRQKGLALLTKDIRISGRILKYNGIVDNNESKEVNGWGSRHYFILNGEGFIEEYLSEDEFKSEKDDDEKILSKIIINENVKLIQMEYSNERYVVCIERKDKDKNEEKKSDSDNNIITNYIALDSPQDRDRWVTQIENIVNAKQAAIKMKQAKAATKADMERAAKQAKSALSTLGGRGGRGGSSGRGPNPLLAGIAARGRGRGRGGGGPSFLAAIQGRGSGGPRPPRPPGGASFLDAIKKRNQG